MLISIITATYNSAKTIETTIQSVLKQTWQEWEYFIMDGGSSDDTLLIVRRYEALFQGRLRLISEPDKSLYDALNKGMRLAQGEVIGLLHSDDFFTGNDRLEIVARTMMEDDALDSVFGDIHFVNGNNLQKCVRYYSSKNFSPRRLRFGYMPAHPSFYCRKRIFDQYGGYALDYKLAADFDMMVRLFYKAAISYKYLPVDMVTMRTGGMSTRNWRNRLLLTVEDAKACRRYGLYSNFLLCCLKYFTKIFEFRL